jgi:hypothetical protein
LVSKQLQKLLLGHVTSALQTATNVAVKAIVKFFFEKNTRERDLSGVGRGCL